MNNTIFQAELSGNVRCHTHQVRSDIGPESWHDGCYVRTDFQNTKRVFYMVDDQGRMF